MTDKLKYVSAALCALFSFLFGGVDMFLKILIAFAIIDYISGIIAAIVNNKLNSASGFIQSHVAKVLKTRNTPRLTFKADRSFIEGEKLSSLIDKAMGRNE